MNNNMSAYETKIYDFIKSEEEQLSVRPPINSCEKYNLDRGFLSFLLHCSRKIEKSSELGKYLDETISSLKKQIEDYEQEQYASGAWLTEERKQQLRKEMYEAQKNL